jgi:hypothetical protein
MIRFFLEIHVSTRVVTTDCLPLTNLILVKGCTNPGSLNFLTVAHDIFSIILLFILAYKTMCHSTCKGQKGPPY